MPKKSRKSRSDSVSAQISAIHQTRWDVSPAEIPWSEIPLADTLGPDGRETFEQIWNSLDAPGLDTLILVCQHSIATEHLKLLLALGPEDGKISAYHKDIDRAQARVVATLRTIRSRPDQQREFRPPAAAPASRSVLADHGLVELIDLDQMKSDDLLA